MDCTKTAQTEREREHCSVFVIQTREKQSINEGKVPASHISLEL